MDAPTTEELANQINTSWIYSMYWDRTPHGGDHLSLRGWNQALDDAKNQLGEAETRANTLGRLIGRIEREITRQEAWE